MAEQLTTVLALSGPAWQVFRYLNLVARYRPGIIKAEEKLTMKVARVND